MTRAVRDERRRARSLVALHAAAIVLLMGACQRERGARQLTPGEPSVEATVATIRTTIQPENRTFAHSLVIGADRARSSDEVDRWRLFDFRNGRVTFVDDIAKTYRHETVAALKAQHDRDVSRTIPAEAPQVAVDRTGVSRVIQGLEASQVFLRAGSYVRELWFAPHPLIPDAIFPMMIASAPPTSSLSGTMKTADEMLLTIGGFPFVDHSEIAYGDKKLSIDRDVVKVERRAVPQSSLSVPAGYRDLTPAPASPQVRKPGPATSTGSDRSPR